MAGLDRTPEAVLCFSKYVDVDANGKASPPWSAVGTWRARPHERFRQVIQWRAVAGHCAEVYGLIRLVFLRQNPSIASYGTNTFGSIPVRVVVWFFLYWRLLREYLRLFHRVPLPWKEGVMVICCLPVAVPGQLWGDFTRPAWQALIGPRYTAHGYGGIHWYVRLSHVST